MINENIIVRKAAETDCYEIWVWTVAPWNEAAQKFYERLGAKEDRDWLNYEWGI